MRYRLSLVLLAVLLAATPAFAAKKALFDNYHAQQAGNADWVIDDTQPVPSPAQSGIGSSTAETYWTGALSAWGVALVKQGYTVATNTAALTYGNSSNTYDLSNYDVLIVDEPNTLFTSAEATAIFNFISNGGGLVAISDHYGSDRNSDGYDSPRIWNALDPSHLLGVHFAVSGESNNNISQTSTNVRAVSTDSITRGPIGNVTGLAYHNGTTMTLYTSANSSVRGEVWTTGTAQTSTTGVMCASAVYGNGRVVFVGDSSPADDGTGASGDDLYNGWTESGATDGTLFLNATLWATRRATATTYTITASAGTGGSISPSGTVTVTAGNSQTFAISANSGYSVSSVVVDGTSVGAVTSYTFSSVAANHTIAASFTTGSSSGYYRMSNGNYSESFADIANWGANFASGTGAGYWGSVASGGSGTIPNGTKTTVSTATWASGTTGGVQKGSGTLILLSTGSTDNTSACAVDLRLDFSGRTAGALGFAWAEVANSTGDRKGSVRVYTSTDNSTFTELTAADVLNVTNNVSSSGTKSAVALPASFSNCATARIRFYYHNGSGGSTGSRPKISLDNVTVTSTASSLTIAVPTPDDGLDAPAASAPARLALAAPQPNPSAGGARLRFTLPRAGHARLEIVDLGGRRVWTSEADYAAGEQSVQWEGRSNRGERVPTGVYFVRLSTPFGERNTRLVRL
jgi:hypothetical protein